MAGEIRSIEDVRKAQAAAAANINRVEPNITFSKYVNEDSNAISTGTTSGPPEDIYPDKFFYVENPQAIFTEVDILTGENKWIRLMQGQNNFFKDLRIEDNGGAKKFTLTLFDRDFFNLEELISGTIAFSQSAFSSVDSEGKDIVRYNTEQQEATDALTQSQKNSILAAYTKILDPIIKKDIKIQKGYNSKYTWRNLLSNSELKSAELAITVVYDLTKYYQSNRIVPTRAEELSTVRGYYNDSDRGTVLAKLASINIDSYKNKRKNMDKLTNNIWREFFYDIFAYLSTPTYYGNISAFSPYAAHMQAATASLITQIEAAMKIKDDLVKANKNQVEETNNLFTLVESKKEITPNIRIRFGYSDLNYGGDAATGRNYKYAENADENAVKLINEETKTNKSISFSYRLKASYKNMTMIRGPYYYFLITGVQSKISKEGLYYTLTGFSVSRMKLDKFKLIQRFAKLKGKPRELLSSLFVTFNEKLANRTDTTTIKSPIKLFIDKNSINYLSDGVETIGDENSGEIEISLGSEACIGKQNQYKSLRSLFNDVCSVFPRKKREVSDDEVAKIYTQTEDGNSGEIERTKSVDLYPLAYTVNETTTIDETGKTIVSGINVIFYFKEPAKFSFCRVYDWGLTTQTIVKDIEINNRNEYASLASYSIYEKGSNKLTSTEINSIGLGNKLTATNYTNDFILTNTVSENNSAGPATRLREAINEAMINSLYEGTITIPGDPFYSFDENMVPYCYPIKVNVWRPSGNSEEGGRVDSQGKSVRSYVSGYYVITSITHNINLSGFTTVLGIMKYPGIDETLSGVKK